MKKFALFSALLISFFSYSQSQVLNGISINGPNGFTKSGDLTWTKGNDLINVLSINAVLSNEDYDMQCKKGSRNSEFLYMEEIDISGNTYPICIQMGANGMLIGQTFIIRDGHSYFVTVASNPGDYDLPSTAEIFEKTLEQIGYMLGYMVVRIKTF